MKAETAKKLQYVLALMLVLAAARALWIWKERREANQAPKPRVEGLLDADYYVHPKKTYAYDITSARQIVGKPAWVREGFRWTYYPHDPATHRTDFKHDAGLLRPLERLDVTDVTTGVAPDAPAYKQVLLVFNAGDKTYAVPIGTQKGSQTALYLDEMLYFEDPRTLYKHWPGDVWQAIEQHQVKSGMSELQAGFALGVGYPETSDDPARKTVRYPNGGNPVVVIYQAGKAASIKPGT